MPESPVLELETLDYETDSLKTTWDKTYRNLQAVQTFLQTNIATQFYSEANRVTLSVDSDEVVIGIQGFTPDLDLILVHQNGMYLHLGQDYTVHADALRLIKSLGNWESGTVIEIIVLKTVTEGIVGGVDGGSLIAGTVMESALNTTFVGTIARKTDVETSIYNALTKLRLGAM